MIQFLLVDFYLSDHLGFIIIMLPIRVIFDKLSIYFHISSYCLCIKASVEMVMAQRYIVESLRGIQSYLALTSSENGMHLKLYVILLIFYL